VVQGEADELVDWREVRAWAEARTPPPQLVLLPDTSHFFHGRLGELQEAVQGFLGRCVDGTEE
jgi:alpha/beta superfamily hydrolase